MQAPAQQAHTRRLDRNGVRRLVEVFATAVFVAAVMFVSAGTWRWPAAWAYLGIYVGAVVTLGLFVAWRHPEAINERGRRSESTKPFDRAFARVFLVASIASLVVSGLDYRFSWSEVPRWLQLVGFLGYLPTVVVPYWVMWVNAYAATTVRVEAERGQVVARDGPYRFVRHPMYAGLLVSYVFLPLALGTLWMYVPEIVGAAALVWRTHKEDTALRAELPGYEEYARHTRFRLVPGIW